MLKKIEKELRLSIRVPKFMDKMLETEMKETGEQKSTIIRTAILEYCNKKTKQRLELRKERVIQL